MRVLAFDSGLERTGYSVIDVADKQETVVDYGCLQTTRGDSLESRLSSLHSQCKQLFEKYTPDEVVLEQLFFFKNQKTVISVAQSQGVVIAIAGGMNAPVSFLTPMVIKQSVTGYGKADKKAVAKMVQLMTKIDTAGELDDTVDAIACGLTFCMMKKSNF